MNQSIKTQSKQDRLPEIVRPLLAWYDSHARTLPWRENPEPYAVWISEIMLQQTRVEAVKPYFARWLNAFPDIAALASASEAEVMKQWEGLGYYSRVRNIHKTAKLVMEQYGGRIPASFEELRKLPGIGEYTAGSIGSIAFGLPVPCVDGNVLRVVARLTAEDSDIGSAAGKKLITGWVSGIVPQDRPGDFNQAMMELGATVCLPNGQPRCDQCPAAFLCEARILDRIQDFPQKTAKPQRKIEKKTVVILLEEGAPGEARQVALRKRPDAGLLAGLWEFPNYEGTLSEAEIQERLKTEGVTIASLTKLRNAKHIFTHIEWDMTGYLAIAETIQKPSGLEPPSRAASLCWTEPEALEKELALPAAFKTYYRILTQHR